MFLYFSDWSSSLTLDMLAEKGAPNGGRVIKVFASLNDPRSFFDKQELRVVESSGDPFKVDEEFHYPGRESYTGEELNQHLQLLGLTESAAQFARALFRFANSPQLESCQYAMEARKPNGEWLFSHPFADLDSLEKAAKDPTAGKLIHIDIFTPRSLERLRQIVDFDQEGLIITDVKEMVRKLRNREGVLRGKER